ncbi:MAG: hypothetical protein LBL91_01105 [Lachnospiraceae bacterium]|jgi:hypothetical protein|nr:hypothetical protein [Lachnospiraceae bacterium]
MDEYSLISSKAIAKHCKEINHKFNTEEVAVLIYRNKNMTVDEKILAYEEILENYPDMEVTQHNYSKEYGTVKGLIKQEIERVKNDIKKLETEEENYIYYYNPYYISADSYDDNEISNIFTNINDLFESISKKNEENNDIGEFLLYKKHINEIEREITEIKEKQIQKINAKYRVRNNKFELLEIYDDYIYWFNGSISDIFIKIPTPFKKGDLLTSQEEYFKDSPPKKVFVLSDIITWYEDFDKRRAEGNYDSSDMNGYGYYIDDDSLYADHCWNYDTFEYFEGKLEGRHRILRGISNLIKDEIDIMTFIHVYDIIKQEEDCKSNMCWFTDEGLKLAGLNEEDVKRWR